MLAGLAVALVTLVAALLATGAAGVPLRDPGRAATDRVLVTAGLVLLLVALDVVIGAARRAGTPRPSLAVLRRVRRERWTPARAGAVGLALVSFYATYAAYRNLKAVVPLLRPGDLFDRQLADFDRTLFAGHDPAVVLHTVLGTGLAAHVLSAVYMLFFVFIPVSLALALVLWPGWPAGLFYATALSINWALAAGSYFLLPSLGPFHADPAAFSSLPSTSVSHLQGALLHQRAAYLRAPDAPGAFQSIGAFASLHVSVYVTAAGAAHLLGVRRRLQAVVWVLTVLTVISTVYFGWHFLADDLAGVVIAGTALALARVLTGVSLRPGRRPRRLPRPTPEPA